MEAFRHDGRSSSKRVYLAAPLFSQAERAFNVSVRDRLLRHVSVFLPQEDGSLLTTLLEGGMDHAQASRLVFKADLAAINSCDALVAILDGRAIDEGVSFELGVAFGLGKVIVGLQTDSRRLLASGNNPMIECALHKSFRSVNDLEAWVELWAECELNETKPGSPTEQKIFRIILERSALGIFHSIWVCAPSRELNLRPVLVLTRDNPLFPPPAFRERRHRSLARRLVAVRWRAVLVIIEREPSTTCPPAMWETVRAVDISGPVLTTGKRCYQ